MKESNAMRMIREIRDKNYEVTKNMSHEEYRVYVNEKAAIGRKIIEQIKQGKH